MAKSDLLTKEIEALKNEIESKMSNGLSQKRLVFIGQNCLNYHLQAMALS